MIVLLFDTNDDMVPTMKTDIAMIYKQGWIDCHLQIWKLREVALIMFCQQQQLWPQLQQQQQNDILFSIKNWFKKSYLVFLPWELSNFYFKNTMSLPC